MVHTRESWTNDAQLVEGLMLHIQKIAQMQQNKDLCVMQKIRAWQDECMAITSSLSDSVDLIFRCRWKSHNSPIWIALFPPSPSHSSSLMRCTTQQPCRNDEALTPQRSSSPRRPVRTAWARRRRRYTAAVRRRRPPLGGVAGALRREVRTGSGRRGADSFA
jgi:hypothetical protein